MMAYLFSGPESSWMVTYSFSMALNHHPIQQGQQQIIKCPPLVLKTSCPWMGYLLSDILNINFWFSWGGGLTSVVPRHH